MCFYGHSCFSRPNGFHGVKLHFSTAKWRFPRPNGDFHGFHGFHGLTVPVLKITPCDIRSFRLFEAVFGDLANLP